MLNRWRRVARHLFVTRAGLVRRFNAAVLDRVEDAVAVAEKGHCGELRVVVETDLDMRSILQGKTSRRRALEIFGGFGVWDTADNNGVLIYVLFADRAVEIIADRGFNGLVTSAEWAAVCRAMEAKFREGAWEEGALAGVEATAGLLARHFPGTGRQGNELPDRPVLL